MLAQVIGCILLSLGELQLVYYGLAVFLTGSGLNVTCLNCMLTQRFAPNDTRRETAFLWMYAGMNIGFFIGFSLSGVFQLSQNYHMLFLLSSLGNLSALMICLFCWKQLADKGTAFAQQSKAKQRNNTLIGLGCIALLPVVITQMLQLANLANQLVIITGLLMLAYILVVAYQQPTKEARNKIIAFAVLMIVGTIFWMLYQIGPMGLTIFIDHNVQREYGHFIIPPQWFQNINTVAIVFGGPLLGLVLNRMRKNGFNINIPTQFALALLFIGLAFVILPISIHYANAMGMVNPNWIVLCYVLQSVGELLISPIGYAMIGSLAPASLQGVMMGMWMLNSGVGATLSSYSSNLMLQGQTNMSPLVTNAGYSHVFLMLGLFALVSAGLLFSLIPRLKALIEEQPQPPKEVDLVVTQRVALCE